MKRKSIFLIIFLFNLTLLNAQNNSEQNIYNDLDQQIAEGKITRKELLEYSLNQYKDEEYVFDVLYELSKDCESKKEFYYLVLESLIDEMSRPQFVEEELNDVDYSYIRLMHKCLFDLDEQESIEDLYKLIISEVLEYIKYNRDDFDYEIFCKTLRNFMKLIGKHPETYFIELKRSLEIAVYQFDDSLTYAEINELFEILENKVKYNWNELFAEYNKRVDLCNELINLLNDFPVEKEVIEYVKKSKEKIQAKNYLTSDIILSTQTFFDENKILQKNFEDSLKLLINVADKNSELLDNEKYKNIKVSLYTTDTKITLFTMYYNEYVLKVNKTIREFNSIATIKGIKSYYLMY